MEDKKPFKETKVGKFLSEKAPEVLNAIGNVLPDQGTFGVVKRMISGHQVLSQEDKEQFAAMSKDFEKEIFGMELSDRAGARTMQITALQQEDHFSKRYIYYLASFIILSATGFGFLLFFVNVPPENKRMVELFSDVYLFAGAMLILNFFFGSSKSSLDKTKMLAK